jgi:hypothetical protein
MDNPLRPLHLVWTAALPPTAVRDNLRAVTARQPTAIIPDRIRFWGRVDDKSFRLRLAENRRNSFYAVITGTLTPADEGTRISARLRLPVGSLILLAFFLSALNSGLCRHITDPVEPVSIGLVTGLIMIEAALLLGFWAISLSSRADAVRALSALWGAPASPASLHGTSTR